MKPALFSIACLLGLPLALPATAADWSPREICRAATKTYFFLDALPGDAADSGDRFGFRSAAGYIYTCRLDGNIAAFYWRNSSGQPMESRSTTFALAAGRLIVTTDLGTETFDAP